MSCLCHRTSVPKWSLPGFMLKNNLIAFTSFEAKLVGLLLLHLYDGTLLFLYLYVTAANILSWIICCLFFQDFFRFLKFSRSYHNTRKLTDILHTNNSWVFRHVSVMSEFILQNLYIMVCVCGKQWQCRVCVCSTLCGGCWCKRRETWMHSYR